MSLLSRALGNVEELMSQNTDPPSNAPVAASR